ncbi:MAG TPA: hypothetical protein VGP93_08720, partial [Polyangiaceae bacterium]|nr:hypothetical protein [Polyangiaceae bacterium]
MSRWQVSHDYDADLPVYTTAAGFGHALLTPVVAFAFADLRVSATLWKHTQEWLPIHSEPSGILSFELEHGVDGRGDYNDQCFARVLESAATVRGEHGGYFDLFVPILARGEVEAILVTGPFLMARPTSSEILERWRTLTGRQGYPADPEFAAYLVATQRILVLDTNQVAAFQRFCERLARLMTGAGDAGKLGNEMAALQAKLARARSAERMWDAVRMILDERSSRTWFSVHRVVSLRRLGLTRIADHVLVAQTKDRAPTDPVEGAVRRHMFQRRAVELARDMGDVLAGQVGDHGVVFLTAAPGSVQRKRHRVQEVAERATRLAKKEFDLTLHFGASAAPGSAPLSRSYQTALGASEAALARGERLIVGDSTSRRHLTSLRELRKELGSALELEQKPDLLQARFDRYVAAVMLESGLGVEPARTHLEVGLERLADPLLASGALDQRSLAALHEALDREVALASNASVLATAYRRAIADLVSAMKNPVPARQDRSLRLALDYIHQHYTEPLRLPQVARVAGFAPSHFSRLFAARECMTFEHYLRALRIERAKHLLTSTEFESQRV